MTNLFKQATHGLGVMTNKVLGEVINVAGVAKTESQKLADLLTEFDLPPGIFPANFSQFAWDRDLHTGILTIRMPGTVDVTFLDGTVLRYSRRITGKMGPGCLDEIEGVQMKGFLGVWVKVKTIWVDNDPRKRDKIHFQTLVQVSKQLEVFDKQRLGVETA